MDWSLVRLVFERMKKPVWAEIVTIRFLLREPDNIRPGWPSCAGRMG
jgi:hypothetical protein